MSTRNKLDKAKVKVMIDDWAAKDDAQLSTEFGVSESTIASWAAEIRKLTEGKCCPARNKFMTKKEIISDVLKDMNIPMAAA